MQINKFKDQIDIILKVKINLTHHR